jgi:hypothetical protein
VPNPPELVHLLRAADSFRGFGRDKGAPASLFAGRLAIVSCANALVPDSVIICRPAQELGRELFAALRRRIADPAAQASKFIKAGSSTMEASDSFAFRRVGFELVGNARFEASAFWGPYTKRYMGVSQIPSLPDGFRFDFSAMPVCTGASGASAGLVESGYRPWQVRRICATTRTATT